MPNIEINVRNKVAEAVGSPEIICGNTGYTVKFDFDAEWSAYTAKTARFRFYRNGIMQRYDVLFTGDTVDVPVLIDIYEVEIGVYAGNLHTSTGARIPCARAITDGDAVHDPPTPDVYNQLMELLAGMQGGGGGVGVTIPRIFGSAGVGGQAQPAETVIDMTNYAWETGSGNTNTGTFDNDLTTRLRCNEFVAIPSNRPSAVLSAFSANNVGLESVIYWYSAAAESSYLSCHTWSVNGTDLPVPDDARYFRLNLKIDNATEMAPADLASCVVSFRSF